VSTLTSSKERNTTKGNTMANIICIFTRKPLNPETLEEINESLPLKKKKTKVPAKDAEKKKEHNDRVLRSYRMK
jgi:hypothetical protein